MILQMISKHDPFIHAVYSEALDESFLFHPYGKNPRKHNTIEVVYSTKKPIRTKNVLGHEFVRDQAKDMTLEDARRVWDHLVYTMRWHGIETH